MSKPYFTKWIQVEGEIKDGDIVREGGTDRLAIHESFGSDTGMSILRYLDDNSRDCSDMFEKVKLCLCTRDIDWTEDLKTEGKVHIYHNSSEPPFKIIGEISEGATWVKEGDEFEHEDLSARGIGSNWCNKTPGPLKFNVKCPTCKYFH